MKTAPGYPSLFFSPPPAPYPTPSMVLRRLGFCPFMMTPPPPPPSLESPTPSAPDINSGLRRRGMFNEHDPLYCFEISQFDERVTRDEILSVVLSALSSITNRYNFLAESNAPAPSLNVSLYLTLSDLQK